MLRDEFGTRISGFIIPSDIFCILICDFRFPTRQRPRLVLFMLCIGFALVKLTKEPIHLEVCTICAVIYLFFTCLFMSHFFILGVGGVI
jgi:hypothetical protein